MKLEIHRDSLSLIGSIENKYFNAEWHPKEQYLPVNLVSDLLLDQGKKMKRGRSFSYLFIAHTHEHMNT